MTNTPNEQPTITPALKLTTAQQALHFWELSTFVRRGWKNPDTNRYNKPTPADMLTRITFYLTRFNWNEKMLARIGELHAVAYKAQQGEQHASPETNSGDVRAASA